MMTRIKQLFKVSRPVSWVNTAYPFGAAYLVNGGGLTAEFWLGCLYFLIPYNLLMYGINDIFDYESDIRNPRKGGIEGAREQKALHPYIWIAVLITNLPFIIWFLLSGSLTSNIVLLGVVFFVIAYSLKYLRFKEVPFLDSITSSLHFVGPMIVGLMLTGLQPEVWPFIAAFFLWGMASHAFGAVQDIVPDRAGGLSSIATVLGAAWTVRLAAGLYVGSAALVLLQGWLMVPIGLSIVLYATNVWPYIRLSDAQSEKANRAWRRFIWLNFMTGFVVTMTIISGVYLFE